MVQVFIKGLILGFIIAAPVGPIGVLCIRCSLANGRSAGLATGLGAATADAVYGCVAAFGLTAVSTFMVSRRFWLGLIGGAFLCYLGAHTFLTKPTEAAATTGRNGLIGAYVSTFFLTITNPMTMLSFVAAFASLGFGAYSDYRLAASLVAGVFIGSAIWWLLLSTGAALLRRRVGPGLMAIVNRVSGLLIFGLGLYSLTTLFR